jgi:hypothetical protein
MSNAGIGLRILLFVAVVNSMFFLIGGATGVWTSTGTNASGVGDVFGMGYDRDNDTYLSGDESNTYGLNETGSQSSSNIFGTDSTWGKITGFFSTLFQLFYAPMQVLKEVNAPAFMIYLMGLIWTILYAVAIIQFIWRGQL